MITDLVVSAFLGIGTAILGVLPNWSVPAPPYATSYGALDAGGTNKIFTFLSALNSFLPITEIAQLAVLLIAGYAVMKGIKFTLWLFEKATSLLP